MFDLDQLPKNISLIDDKQYNNAAKEFMNLDRLFTQDPDTLKYSVDIDINELLQSVNTFCLNSYASIDWIFGIQLKHRHMFLKNYIHPSPELQKYISQCDVDKNYIGMIGHTGEFYANLALFHCDLLICLGARLDLRQTGTELEAFLANKSIVRVDVDEKELAHGRVRGDLNFNLGLAEFFKLIKIAFDQ